MKQPDWSKAPEGYPVWIEDLAPDTGFDGSGWHRDDVDRYTDEDGEYWTKPEEGIYRVHSQAPRWGGTGLPPVGVVCEVMSATASGEWLEATIVAHDGAAAVYRLYDGSYGGDLEFFEDNPARPLFRPIRTPEQIAAEERDVAIKNMVDRFALYSHPDIQWRALFEQMYDCGCRMTAEDKR